MMNSFQIVAVFLIVSKSVLMPFSAFANSDQEASEMMMSTSENENMDAVSRWSKENTKSKKSQKVLRAVPLAPISEASFENNGSHGRSPASVAEGGTSNRGPATVATVAPTDHGVLPKAWTRTLAKRKVYQEVAIIANDLGFFPSTVFVTQGVPVKIYVTGASAKSQCFMLDAFGVRRQIHSQKIEEITFTPDQSGSFAFSCPMNGAKGIVMVKEIDVGRLPASVSVSKADSEDQDQEEEHGDKSNNESNFEK